MTLLAGISPGTCLTSRDLRVLGCNSAMLTRLTKSGHLEKISHGVYVVPSPRADDDPFVQARKLHLTRASALLTTWDGAYLTGPSAALAHGLPLLQIPDALHVSRQRPIDSRRPGVHSHRPWQHGVVTTRLGLSAQEVTAAVIDIAARNGVLPGLVTGDAAARSGRLENAVALLDAWGRRPGAAAARTVIASADGRRESPLETRTAFEARSLGFDLLPQYRILDEHGDFVARVDFVVLGHRLVVEVDGLTKYAPGALRQEKLRQGDIERLRWVVVRVGHRDLGCGRLGPLLWEGIRHADAVFGPWAAPRA